MTVVHEWADKAEADNRAAVANRRRREPLPDIVCYHCQQSAEKYLKAYLFSAVGKVTALHSGSQPRS